MGVIKADAYGHGSRIFARELEAMGFDWLAVATADEGIELRRDGIQLPILVLGIPIRISIRRCSGGISHRKLIPTIWRKLLTGQRKQQEKSRNSYKNRYGHGPDRFSSRRGESG